MEPGDGPGDARILFHLGCGYLDGNMYEDAVRVLTEALRLDYPQTYALLMNRARAHLGQGKTELAQLDLDDSLQICPTFSLHSLLM